MTLVLLLLLAQPSTDELVRQLEADALGVREHAARELASRGTAILEDLRTRASTARGELKARLDGVIQEVERRERLSIYLGKPSRVTLKVDRAPLKDVLAELRRQAPTPIVLRDVAESDPVTLDVSNALFFEAVEKLCRAHGRIKMRLQGIGDRCEVQLTPGDPAAARYHIEEQFAVEAGGLTLTESSDFRGRRTVRMSLSLHAAWERGTRPVGARIAVTSLTDEEGRTYRTTDAFERDDGDEHFGPRVNNRASLYLDPVPPDTVKALREISGVLEIRFPSDVAVASLARPLGKKDVEVAGGGATFTLLECVREGSSCRASLETTYDSKAHYADGPVFELVDATGEVHRSHGWTGRGLDSRRMVYTLPFELAGDADIVELRVCKPAIARGRTMNRSIAWTLKDVRFR